MQTNVETALGAAATKSMGGGAATSMFGFAINNELVLLVGIVVTVLGFVVNLIARKREDKRQQDNWMLMTQQAYSEEERRRELHALQVAKLKGEIDELHQD